MDAENETTSLGQSVAQSSFAMPYGKNDLLETIDPELIANGKQYAEVVIQGEKFIVPVMMVSYPESKHAEIIRRSLGYECRIENVIYPFLCPDAVPAEFDLLPQAHQEDQKQTVADKILLPLFVKLLAEVGAAHGGTVFYLHAPPLSGFYEPMKDVRNEIHVFMGTTPMLEHGGEYPDLLFGINVEAGGYFHRLFAPSKKRGVALSDGTKGVVQIVGNNIYVLFNPILLSPLGEEVTMVIFRKTIALAMNWFAKHKEVDGEPARPELTTDAMSRLAEDYFKNYHTLYKAKIAEAHKEISSLEEKLRFARRDLMHTTHVHRALFESGTLSRDIVALMVADHARIASHPLVASATLLPEVGFEVRTKRIVIEHDGAQYKIAEAFVCRFDLHATIAIWAEGSYHQKGISHPHISPAFGHCFGNVSDNIEKAVSEYRYGDAVEYVLIWLTEGYTPENVIHSKIEEWPLENETVSEVGNA